MAERAMPEGAMEELHAGAGIVETGGSAAAAARFEASPFGICVE